MLQMQKTKIKVSRYDIFDYVIGISNFDPIEKCIDPILYEVFETFIFDNEKKEDLPQGKAFRKFEQELIKLKMFSRKMDNSEIDRISIELEEIAPIFVDQDDGVVFCSMSFTIAPATDMRSLFLFDEFFVLLEEAELPALLRATCITALFVAIGTTLLFSLVSF